MNAVDQLKIVNGLAESISSLSDINMEARFVQLWETCKRLESELPGKRQELELVRSNLKLYGFDHFSNEERDGVFATLKEIGVSTSGLYEEEETE